MAEEDLKEKYSEITEDRDNVKIDFDFDKHFDEIYKLQREIIWHKIGMGICVGVVAICFFMIVVILVRRFF